MPTQTCRHVHTCVHVVQAWRAGAQHPFLMTLRYAFQTKAALYFVLDFYQGGELELF